MVVDWVLLPKALLFVVVLLEPNILVVWDGAPKAFVELDEPVLDAPNTLVVEFV